MTKVLYVEDEALLAICMESALLAAGCNVVLAHDGKDGVDQALQFSPQIIVTDFMMPRMDGPTMLRVLQEKGFRVPVVLTTAVPREDIAQEILDRVNVYLAKPFSEQDLVDAVASLGGAAPHN